MAVVLRLNMRTHPYHAETEHVGGRGGRGVLILEGKKIDVHLSQHA